MTKHPKDYSLYCSSTRTTVTSVARFCFLKYRGFPYNRILRSRPSWRSSYLLVVFIWQRGQWCQFLRVITKFFVLLWSKIRFYVKNMTGYDHSYFLQTFNLSLLNQSYCGVLQHCWGHSQSNITAQTTASWTLSFPDSKNNRQSITVVK